MQPRKKRHVQRATVEPLPPSGHSLQPLSVLYAPSIHAPHNTPLWFSRHDAEPVMLPPGHAAGSGHLPAMRSCAESRASTGIAGT